MNVVKLTQHNFDNVIQESKLLLIDFWAEWCAPCKAFTKVIEQVANQYPEFIFGSVNIEEEKQLAEEFAIRSIPAIMILRKSVVIFAETGAMTATNLTDLLEQTKKIKDDQIGSVKN